jgi:hypothetical protein
LPALFTAPPVILFVQTPPLLPLLPLSQSNAAPPSLTSVAISTLPAKRSAPGLIPLLRPLLYISLSLPCSSCRPAHRRAEQRCAAPPAKSDAPTANSLELEPREALRRIVEASPTNSRANPLPSRSDLASSCRLPRRRWPPSAPHRRATSLLLLRPIEALGELSVPLLSLVRALDSVWPVAGAPSAVQPRAAASPRVPPAVPSSSSSAGKRAVRSTCLRRTRRVLGPDYCAAVRRQRVKAVPPP